MTNGHHERTGAPPSADQLAESVRTLGLPPEPASAGAARRFVTSALMEWNRTEICDDAAVCTAELATNAILHSRSSFTVAVRQSARGARVDLLDERPDRLPVTVPNILDPLATGTTGRGLLLIAALAERWGYFTTDTAKTVWVELTAAGPIGGSTEPLIELADRPEPGAGVSVSLLDVPARVAIASGVQVDELVREIQLYRPDLADAVRASFADLLDRSARPRLVGRQEAFRTVVEGRDRYDVVLNAEPSELVAVAEFSVLLEQLTADPRRVVGAVSDEVRSMRAWINSEVVAQQAGLAPTPYSGRYH